MKFNINFMIRGGFFVLVFLLCNFIFVQCIIIGMVMDVEMGEFLIGVNIFVVGFSIGIIIDFDGVYFFNVLENVKELEFFYIGYSFQCVEIGS